MKLPKVNFDNRLPSMERRFGANGYQRFDKQTVVGMNGQNSAAWVQYYGANVHPGLKVMQSNVFNQMVANDSNMATFLNMWFTETQRDQELACGADCPAAVNNNFFARFAPKTFEIENASAP